MPIYEYRCTSCGHVFEKIQKFSDAPLTTCDTCHGKLEKLVSRTAFQLKGGGWFSSGYHAGGSSAPTESSGAAESSSKPQGKEGKEGKDGKGSGGGCGPSCACH